MKNIFKLGTINGPLFLSFALQGSNLTGNCAASISS
jgi:hypothetical protein